jgi:DNA-binding Xre family transcriptional regulator
MSAKKFVYKYNIKKILQETTNSNTQRLVLKARIYEKLGISEETLSHWSNIKVHQKRKIPADDLKQVATILGCKMEDLFNQETI